MRAYNRALVIALLAILAVFAGANLFINNIGQTGARQYRVDAQRAYEDILEGGLESIDLSRYPTVANIERLADGGDENAFFSSRYDYIVKVIDDVYYRFDYVVTDKAYSRNSSIALNLSLAVMAVLLVASLIFVRVRLIAPFHRLREMPYELSKGNLTAPLKETQHRFFGRFVWGMDMLRERLERHKENELRLQGEKKKLILSLSHDIKLPLSAIKLYCAVLTKRLYDSEERQREIAGSISAKADEIEGFVSQIVKASNEDFIELEVTCGEFYLSAVINALSDYYADKLHMLRTDFSVGEYRDCLLKGDPDRATEVLQNAIENAIKYGDASRIAIELSDDEGCRLITVRNTGCTLSVNELPHIFDSFWRGSNTGNTGGNGLGLYIARQLMNRMGGEIFARREGDEMCVTAVFVKA